MANWPPSLKPIGRYLARAKEVQATHPLVAYYCRYYSLLRAIELRDTQDATANQFVASLLDRCEADKIAIGFDDGTHRAQLEQHALQQFYLADDQDRAGNATKRTATTFYGAMCFLEVCSLFGTLSDELEQKRRYAKWKAADITKALREGRMPQPASPAEQQQRVPRAASPHSPVSPKPAPSSPPQRALDAQPAPTRDAQRARDEQRRSPVPPAPPLREYDSPRSAYEPSAPPPPLPPPLPLPDEAPQLPQHAPQLPLPDEAPQLPHDASAYVRSDERSALYPAPLGGDDDDDGDAQRVSPAAPTTHSDAANVAPMAPPPIPALELPPDDGAARGAPQHAVYRTRRAERVHVPTRPLPKTPVSTTPSPASITPPVAASGAARDGSATVTTTATTTTTTTTTKKKERSVYKPSVKQTQEAQRLCKYAASALDFEDMSTAVSNLQQALQLLTGCPP